MCLPAWAEAAPDSRVQDPVLGMEGNSESFLLVSLRIARSATTYGVEISRVFAIIYWKNNPGSSARRFHISESLSANHEPHTP